jgi:hypothetical protein
MKTMLGTELREESAFGEDFRGGSRHEQFIRVERINDFAGVERVELNSEICVREFWTVDDFLDALIQRSLGLGMRGCWQQRGDEKHGNGSRAGRHEALFGFQEGILHAMIQMTG